MIIMITIIIVCVVVRCWSNSKRILFPHSLALPLINSLFTYTCPSKRALTVIIFIMIIMTHIDRVVKKFVDLVLSTPSALISANIGSNAQVTNDGGRTHRETSAPSGSGRHPAG